MKVRSNDGRVHFSNLKKFALSPAHYRVSCEEPFEATRAMRIGTGMHALTLGQRPDRPVVLFDADERRGNAWKDFQAANPGAEILTRPEWREAEAMANAVKADPVARTLLEGSRSEVPIKWDEGGIECATDGIDVVGDGFIADLKSTASAEPGRFQRLALNMFYHAQMAFYESAAKSRGFDTSKGLYLIGVESSKPYAVTVFRLAPEVVELGRKCVGLWLETLQSCEENDHWPAYAQAVVDFDAPVWMAAPDDDEDAEAAQ